MSETIVQLTELIKLFGDHCTDKTTLNALADIVGDRDQWRESRALFYRIREKTLVAERSRDVSLSAQYHFEEICAKALYNFSGQPAPFDLDSAYHVIPAALTLAHALHLSGTLVLRIVIPRVWASRPRKRPRWLSFLGLS
jgi:hypothetical protein